MFNYIFLMLITFLSASMLDARQVKNSLGRFAQTGSSYDNGSSRSNSSTQSDIAELRDVGGLTIAGFPEGCAYATMEEPLLDHVLGFGRIEFMGGRWVFQYIDQNDSGRFETAEIARNLGLMGQNPEQSMSVDLMARTPRDRYVVAQLLDRSDMGLGPIVTCISPIFRGTIVPGRTLDIGQDYWIEYKRFRDYRDDYDRRSRWRKWKNRWKQKEYDWRKHWREKGREQRRDRDHDRRHRRDLDRDHYDRGERHRIEIQSDDDKGHRGRNRAQQADDDDKGHRGR